VASAKNVGPCRKLVVLRPPAPRMLVPLWVPGLGAAQCQADPLIWAAELETWLQAPASPRRLRVLGWAGSRVRAGAVALPVVGRCGKGMGLETWRGGAKHRTALVCPAARLCQALLPRFFGVWHVRARCEGAALGHERAPLLLTVTSACCHGRSLLLAVHLWPCSPANPGLV